MWLVPRCQTKWAQPISPPPKEKASHRVTLCPKTVLFFFFWWAKTVLFIYLFIFLKIWLLVLELVTISIESIEILQKPVILIIGQTRRSPRLSQEIKILQYSYNSASHSSQVTTHKSQVFTGEVHLVTSECFSPLTVGEIHLTHILIWNFIFSKKKEKKNKKKEEPVAYICSKTLLFFL